MIFVDRFGIHSFADYAPFLSTCMLPVFVLHCLTRFVGFCHRVIS